jgi:hypothetical protein
MSTLITEKEMKKIICFLIISIISISNVYSTNESIIINDDETDKSSYTYKKIIIEQINSDDKKIVPYKVEKWKTKSLECCWLTSCTLLGASVGLIMLSYSVSSPEAWYIFEKIAPTFIGGLFGYGIGYGAGKYTTYKIKGK